jgi:hypothetical protein
MAKENENVREFSEKRAQSYAVEITLALEFLQKYGNLHRVYTYDNMAQSFSNVVKAYQVEMDLPLVPKASFRLSVVGADGFPLFFGSFWETKNAQNFYKRVDPEPEAPFVANKE